MSKIDRKALVGRHNIVITEPNNRTSLTVGNGKFGYTVDVTGMQTFPMYYREEQSLCTLAEWGWHKYPMPEHLKGVEYQYRMYKAGDRMVPYPVGYYANYKDGRLVEGLPPHPEDYDFETQTQLYDYLRTNPHRCHLGMNGFTFAEKTEIEDIKNINQVHDLYTGMITSNFTVHGEDVTVNTCADFEHDAYAVKVKSALLKDGKMGIYFEYPNSHWENPACTLEVVCDGNYTEMVEESDGFVMLKRTLDEDVYFVGISYTNGKVTLGANRLEIATNSDEFEMVVEFSEKTDLVKNFKFDTAAKSSEKALENYWEKGGMIDFGAVNDPRAKELEDRMIKSMYITRINSCTPFPPHESGLTGNSSWKSTSHTEMHYWHAAHFAQFSRPELLDISLNSYNTYMPELERVAKKQGYKGLRVPKMVSRGLEECPSYIAPLLLWEQPHPIMLAELLYRVNNDKAVLEKYFTLIEGLVEFMLDILIYEPDKDRYVLDAPLIPAQEFHDPEVVKNPIYELEYWYFGFDIYKKWCERLGKTPLADLEEKMTKLAKSPVKDGLYLLHENCPDSYTRFNIDHPSFLCGYGVLPGERMDKETVSRSLDKTLEVWEWDETWGWDYALLAMCAAKLDRREDAINVLLKDTSKNRYSINGHVYQYPGLPCYIDTNGALLNAIGFLAAGCDSNPGCKFPEDWDVKVEDIVRYV